MKDFKLKFAKTAIIVLSNIALVNSVTAQNNDEDDILLDVVPAITAATKNDALPPQWGALNGLCCPNSAATFSLTIDGVTRSSVLASCDENVDASFEGFVETSSGLKTVSGTLTSSTCPDFSFDFQDPFVDETNYLYTTALDAGNPVVELFFAPRTAKVKATPQSLKKANKASKSFSTKQKLSNEGKQSYQLRR